MMVMRDAWQNLSLRDQRMLLMGGALALLLLAYALLWLPLQRSRDDLRQQVAAAQASLRWMRAAAEELNLRRGVLGSAETSHDHRSLLARVDSGAREQGLGAALMRVEPSAEGAVNVVFQQASFDALVGWLESMSRTHGTRIAEFSAQSTGASGQVDARALLVESP